MNPLKIELGDFSKGGSSGVVFCDGDVLKRDWSLLIMAGQTGHVRMMSFEMKIWEVEFRISLTRAADPELFDILTELRVALRSAQVAQDHNAVDQIKLQIDSSLRNLINVHLSLEDILARQAKISYDIGVSDAKAKMREALGI